jgi:hypothetical protein
MNLAVVQERRCGDCSACCTLLGVAALNKPENARCKHQREPGGCDVYDVRPEGCRNYRCLWHRLPGGDPAEFITRPDVLGVMLDQVIVGAGSPAETAFFVAWEVEPGSFERARGFVAQVVRKQGRNVFVRRFEGYYVEFDGEKLIPTEYRIEGA